MLMLFTLYVTYVGTYLFTLFRSEPRHEKTPLMSLSRAFLFLVHIFNLCMFEQVVVAAGEYTTGSAWLSEEKLLEQARDMWKRLSDEQKGAYGEDYFETALRSLEKYTQNAVSTFE